MMSGARHALLIDFGSTYTKLRAVDLAAARITGSGQGPSTVTSDVTIGLDLALKDLSRRLGGRLPAFDHRLASSSAAGGLRMVTIGLVKELTAEAARRAALGAGAKLIGTFAYKLTRADLARILSLAPDIILLAGGTDGGNADVIIHNAALLAGSSIACPIVIAGNRNAADDVMDVLAAAGKAASLTQNVMPEFNVLDIEPAREAIRQVFIKRIVQAKGIDKAAAQFDAVLMPTPAAVLEGAMLIAAGSGEHPGLGTVLVVDVGGATTDVHSIGSGDPTRPEIVQHGLPEPFAKRTVEGDLGLRHNAASIVEAAGAAAIAADAGCSEAEIAAMLALIAADVERLPASDAEIAFDAALARAAVCLGVARHAGNVETVYSATGPVVVQRGKDLSEVTTLIGTGGPLVNARDPGAILAAALADRAAPASLRPRAPRLMIDRDYVLYAVGLLAACEPDAALALAYGNLQDV